MRSPPATEVRTVEGQEFVQLPAAKLRDLLAALAKHMEHLAAFSQELMKRHHVSPLAGDYFIITNADVDCLRALAGLNESGMEVIKCADRLFR